jgi:putative SOS response-associated peptidase YedK
MLSWADAVWLDQVVRGEGLRDGDNDVSVTFRVMDMLPVIVWDRALGQRRVVKMRWGFPHRDNPGRPDPIHARAETIDQKPTFRDAFREGQRGIVLVKTFNEAPDLPGKTQQHTITPGGDGAIGIAFLWRRFVFAASPVPLLACVMVTVPANRLIATLPTDRMPAILAPEDWGPWLGEDAATPDAAKACLRTVEGVRWTMTPEECAARPRRKPTVSDPTGFL